MPSSIPSAVLHARRRFLHRACCMLHTRTLPGDLGHEQAWRKDKLKGEIGGAAAWISRQGDGAGRRAHLRLMTRTNLRWPSKRVEAAPPKRISPAGTAAASGSIQTAKTGSRSSPCCTMLKKGGSSHMLLASSGSARPCTCMQACMPRGISMAACMHMRIMHAQELPCSGSPEIRGPSN